jgi:antitoxin FitA
MSSITIRNLDPAVKERLRVRAAQHGIRWRPRPVTSSAAPSVLDVRARSTWRMLSAGASLPLGGADDLEMPPREPARDPPRFD